MVRPDDASRPHTRRGPGDRHANRALELPPGGGAGQARRRDGARRTDGSEGVSSPARRAALGLTTIAALYVVLLLSLFQPCGGLQGRYLVAGQGGVEALVDERVDPQINFSVPQKLDAAY